MYDPTLPSLSDLLGPTCLAEVARRIGRPRGFIFRLRHGQVLRVDAVIPALAAALHRDEAFIRRVCANDAARKREQGRAS